MKSENIPFKNKLVTIAFIIGLLVSVLGLLVIIAWQNDIAFLKTFGLGAVTMKANLGVCFLFSGLALMLLQFSLPAARLLSRLLSISAIIIGLLTILEIVFSVSFGIDEILFRKVILSRSAVGPVRMALNAAICQVLTGVILFFLSLKNIRFNWFMEFSLVLTFSISFLGLLGFLFGLSEFSEATGYTNMAVIAALLFLLMCFALLSAYFSMIPDRITIDQKFLAGIIFASSLIIFITLLSSSGYRSLREASERGDQTQIVKNYLNLISSDVLDVETGVRGYLINDNIEYLAFMDKAKKELAGSIQELSILLQDNKIQLVRLDTLDTLIKDRVEHAELIKSMIQSNKKDSAIELFLTNKGKNLTDKIRVLINTMKNEENQLLKIRNETEIRHSKKIQTIVVLNLIVQLLLMVFIFIVILRNINQRRAALKEVQLLNEGLEKRVVERTASLAKSEERFRSTLDNMLEGCQIIDSDWKYLYLNNTADIHNRCPKGELLGKRYMDMWPGIEKTEVFQKMKQCMDEKVPCHMENEFKFPDTTSKWFDLSIQPVPEGVFILSIDITDRIKAEREIKKANRVYAVLSNINQTIVRVKDKQKLHDETCRIAVEDGTFRFAWIGLVDEKSNKVVLVASAGCNNEFIKKVDLTTDIVELNSGPVAEVIITGNHKIINDLASELRMIPICESTLQSGIKSFAVFPIKVFGKTIGVLMLYSDDQFFFDKDEIKLLDELAMDISFANEFIENEAIRRASEEKRNEAQERFEDIFRFSPLGIALSSIHEGRYLEVNDAFLQLTGFSRDEVIDRTSLELNLINAEDRSKITKELKQHGTSKSSEAPIHTKDGQIRFIHIYTQEITIGTERFYLAIHEDITERKVAEKALDESEERFRSIMENSADAIFITDPQGKYLYSNKAVTNMLGFSLKEMKKMTILNITPAGKENEYLNLFGNLIKEGKLLVELDLRKKDGNLVPVELNAVVLPDGNVFGSCRDITLRKLTEEELLKHRSHLEELVTERTEKLRKYMDETNDLYENAPCGYHSIDANGKFIRINNTELKWLGYTRDEVIGIMSPSDLLTPESQERFRLSFPVFLEKGEISGLEFEFVRKDGSTFFGSLNGTAIYDSAGNFFMSRSTLFDVTNRKIAENALTIAKREAEEANMAKSEFLANMSHEIRTPMNAVLGYTELLSNTLIEPTQKEYINSIKSSGRSLLTLINDILDLSKIEAGKLELEYDFVDTYSFFAEFEKIFSLKVSEKGLKFILDITSGTPHGIYIDEARVRQIAFNLIGNAIKFTSQGKIILKVFTENPQVIKYSKKKSEEFIDLIIEVEDTGIGISEELQEAIFEPFVQERNYKHFGGTGLGLAITRRLAGLMNGTIKVWSKPGKGSKFTVSIPEIAYQRDFSGTNIDIQIDPSEIEFEEAVILIVDDVEHNRNYLKDALKNTKLKIHEADNGVTGYKIAREIVPDLIIADIRMPKMDGFQLLNKIKSDKKLKKIPVIAYSASVLKAQKERIHNSEFAGLLIKPVKVTELYLELMNILTYKSTRTTESDKQLFGSDHPGEIVDLAGLIQTLETTFHETWKTFAVTQPIGEIREFGKDLEKLGIDHNSGIVAEYGKKLINAGERFDIGAMLELLGKYTGIIESLKNSIKNISHDKS